VHGLILSALENSTAVHSIKALREHFDNSQESLVVWLNEHGFSEALQRDPSLQIQSPENKEIIIVNHWT
jgi:hypothetical protein